MNRWSREAELTTLGMCIFPVEAQQHSIQTPTQITYSIHLYGVASDLSESERYEIPEISNLLMQQSGT